MAHPKSELIIVPDKKSSQAPDSGIVISLRETASYLCKAVIGYPGLPNVYKEMENGDAVLYETPQYGIVEVRAVELSPAEARFLVTQVSPKAGLLGGSVERDFDNAPFTEADLTKIAQSIVKVKEKLSARKDIRVEQLELVDRKLDEIQAAAERMGRKDWINYVAGSLTSLCISAAFAPDVTKEIFVAVNAAFQWLFATAEPFLTAL